MPPPRWVQKDVAAFENRGVTRLDAPQRFITIDHRIWVFNRATLVNCVSIDRREHEHRPSRIDKRPLLHAFDLEEKVIRVGTMKRGTCTASAREELQR